MSLYLSIITPDKIALQEEVSYVYLPGPDGEIGILTEHTPLISVLEPGELRYATLSGEIKHLIVGSGFVQVENNKIDVVVGLALEDAENAEQSFEEAIARAQKALEHIQQMSEEESARLEASIGKTISLLELRKNKKLRR